MFELSVACKYLIPRRRQLSVSIISLISVLVIALVVWLIVVFFSVTDGLEKNWIQKLTALTAPVRINPTEAYYQSYYYLADTISDSSNYAHKTLREKQFAPSADPYNPDTDEEIPSSWPKPDVDPNGAPKDLVKLVFASLNNIKNVPGLTANDYELTASHIQLNLMRRQAIHRNSNLYTGTNQSVIAYPAFLGNFEGDNPRLGKTLLPIESQDLNNLFFMAGINKSKPNEEQDEKLTASKNVFQKRLKHFLEYSTITQLQAGPAGWNIPLHLLPTDFEWDALAVQKGNEILRLIVPQFSNQLQPLQKSLEEEGLTVYSGKAHMHNGVLTFTPANTEPRTISRITLTLAAESLFPASLIQDSAQHAASLDELRFESKAHIQGSLLEGIVAYRGLEIAQALPRDHEMEASSFWITSTIAENGKTNYIIPSDPELGEGIVLPKTFREAGAMIGDRGTLSYVSLTPSILQEQLIPVFVAGFYDPGIIPIGGKFILAKPETVSLIRGSHQPDDKTAATNGINVRFDQLDQADLVKAALIKEFKDKGIQRYWNVETYREFEFAKEIMRELQSQKYLFMLIAVVIILVACSNIISMLVILVNDKKIEIGILRSMGASSKSIALIFGLSGAIIGVLGSMTGIVAAILTLRHLDTLVNLLSKMQGHDMFSANLYGEVLPSELSFEALTFVIFATVCMSLLAGIVPAVKACMVRPSQILRSNGG